MTNRWIRFLLAVLALAASAGAAYRIVQDEQHLAQELAASRASAFAAESALAAVDDLKATLHAYVAPGQGADFWTARAALHLNQLRSALLELDAAATARGVTPGDSLDISDRLAAAEHRAQTYARTDQPLLAGEIIFREARDLIDGLRINIVRVRDQLAAGASGRQIAIRQEQMYLAGAAAGILALVMLLLVPTGSSKAIEPVAQAEPVTAVEPAHDMFLAAIDTPAPVIRPDLAPVANLCVDLATVADSAQMEHMLDRARKLLDARGVIVWTSSPDRSDLQPVVAAGYDARMLARLGPIKRDAANLTADAFRDNVVHSNPASDTAAAAIAVPLPSPEGAVGVLSAELNPGVALADETLVAARLVAAQLGALLGGTLPKSQDAADVSASAAVRSSP